MNATPFHRHLLAPGLAAVAGIWLSIAPAQAATPAEAFIQENVNRGTAILGDTSLGDEERRKQFRAFIESLTDARRIALFTLGNARRTATEEEIGDFVEAFRDYAVAVYESRLGEYSGQTLKVTGSLVRASDDVIVKTIIAAGSGQSEGEPIDINFRVRKDGDRFVVVDVQVVGIWLAIDQREQFASYLAKNGYSVRALTDHLKAQAVTLRADGTAAATASN